MLQERIFKKLFETAEIANYNLEEMTAYEESLKTLRDNYATNQYVEKMLAKAEAQSREAEVKAQEAEVKTREAEKKTLLIAKSMKEDGLDVRLIAKHTGLSQEEIEKLNPWMTPAQQKLHMDSDRKQKLLCEIKQRVQQVAPSAEVYLYGSRARGEGGRDSDWDVLILVEIDAIDYTFEKQLTYPLYDLEFDTGELISPMVYSKQQWHTQHKKTPFYQQITPELVAL